MYLTIGYLRTEELEQLYVYLSLRKRKGEIVYSYKLFSDIAKWQRPSSFNVKSEPVTPTQQVVRGKKYFSENAQLRAK